MSDYLFLVVMCAKTTCVGLLNIINTIPSLLTSRLSSPPHRLADTRHKRDGLTSLSDLDQSCLVSIISMNDGYDIFT